MATEIDIKALAQSLYAQHASAITVPYRICSLPGWIPAEHNCHRNVDYWCRCTPGDTPLRGWIVFDWSAAFLIGQPARFHFTAHSVVKASHGSLFDLTPSRASKRYPFLAHPGHEEEFIALIDMHKITQLDHILV